jgi:hypothetical protein
VALRNRSECRSNGIGAADIAHRSFGIPQVGSHHLETGSVATKQNDGLAIAGNAPRQRPPQSGSCAGNCNALCHSLVSGS